VYWTRRVLVLAVAFALVFGVGRLLGGGAEETGPTAQPAAVNTPADASTTASPDASATSAASPAGPSASPTTKAKATKTREPLAMPTGPCPDSDVTVAPVLEEDAYAGTDVRLTLELSTVDSPACNWEVSADTVAVKLTSGSDRIWSSQECPSVVPEEPVVLRNNKPVLVDVMWNGRRSDPDCSRTTAWAEPGYYHVATAAMGSEPTDKQFRLRSPAPVTITPSPTQDPERDKKRSKPSESPEA